MATTAIDWTAIATAAAAIVAVVGTGWATITTIKSNEESISKQLKAQAEQNRKQQLADMMSTALSHFTRGSQNRGVGIAALRMIQANTADLNKEKILTDGELTLYRNSIQILLYGQLLYLYIHGEKRDEAHEAANILVMSQWLFSDYIDDLQPQQKAALLKAMEKYEVYVQSKATEPVIDDVLRNMPTWKMQVQPSPGHVSQPGP